MSFFSDIGKWMDDVTENPMEVARKSQKKIAEAAMKTATVAVEVGKTAKKTAGDAVSVVKENPRKVAMGAAAGVAGVVALPVLGAVGAVSAVGVVSGTIIGAGAGIVLAESDEEAKEEAVNSARQSERVMFKEKLDNAFKEVEGVKERQEMIFAMCSLGMATANADDNILDVEKNALKEFIESEQCVQLSDFLKKNLQKIYDCSPSLEQSVESIKKLNIPKKHLGIFDMVIEIVAESDGKFCAKEKEFQSRYKKLMSAE